MLSKIKTCVLYGLDGYEIDVETDLSGGLPNFSIVGLPDASIPQEESMEVTKIYSISGLLNLKGLIKKRPFRSPHHTSSRAAMAGGGSRPNPSEVSLSHYGVLFLDEYKIESL
jgi:predicted ATPase with chaperone activity